MFKVYKFYLGPIFDCFDKIIKLLREWPKTLKNNLTHNKTKHNIRAAKLDQKRNFYHLK